MSLTGAPLPLPSSVTSASPAADVPEAVVQVLAVRQPGAPGLSSQEALNAATGPGNVLSGQVTELTLNGTATLVTASGAEITMHNLPTQLMQLGSAVTLRIASQQPVLQATLLQIDGKPVAGLLARAALAAGGTLNTPAAGVPGTPAVAPSLANAAPPPNLAAPSLSQAAASPLIDSTLAVVASLVASVEGNPSEAAALLGAAASLPGANPALASTLAAGLAQMAQDGTSPLPAPQPGIDESLLHAPLQTGSGFGSSATVIATLIRAALPRPGGVVPPLGTRYALAITAIAPPSATATEATDASAADAAATDTSATDASATDAGDIPPMPAPPSPAMGGAASQPAPQTAIDSANFVPQVTILAGRVTATNANGTIEIDTALGTLSLPTPDTPVLTGSAVQLRVSAVAPPLPGIRTNLAEASSAAATGTAKQTISPFAAALEAMAEAEIGADPWAPGADSPGTNPADAPPVDDPAQAAAAAAAAQSLPTQLGQLFAMPPTALAAVIYGFLAGTMPSPARRWPDSPARKALEGAGRDDLVAKLDGDAHSIGQTLVSQPPAPWLVTTLPYLGQASLGPVKVYRRQVSDEEKQAIRAGKSGEHFVIEVDLAKLGPMQFEGLVRERRFDLALRTRQPLHADLQQAIRRAYADILGAGGYGGELTFARTIAFPLVSPIQTTSHREVSA